MTPKSRPVVYLKAVPVRLSEQEKASRKAAQLEVQNSYRDGWRWGVLCGFLPGALTMVGLIKLGVWWGWL